jgi:hypothetical protein
MQRWEYRVVSLQDGTYTASLNEYGLEGWELVTVASQRSEVPARDESRGFPLPGAIGRLEDAAGKLSKVAGGATDPEPGTTLNTLLWVLRRPLPEYGED